MPNDGDTQPRAEFASARTILALSGPKFLRRAVVLRPWLLIITFPSCSKTLL